MYNQNNLHTQGSYLQFIDKKLIIFDLDGTLIDSALDLAAAINYMLQKLNRDKFPQETIHGWVGNGALMLVQRALFGQRSISESLDQVLVQKALKIFLTSYADNLCNATLAYPNVSSTLQTLKQDGYSLAIVSNKPFDFIEPILKGLELNGLFMFILGGDSLNEKKPSPLPLLHVCKKLDTSVDKTLMVGDSKNDIQAASACGMQSVAVTYGYNYGEDIGTYRPNAMIDDFSELLKLL